jgi:hypothetical protein
MRPFIAAVVAVGVLTMTADAQPQQPTANAALRYWTAFAALQDPPADPATTDLLLRVADGNAAWDEGRLGAILDANAEALDIMIRASTLQSCDWGVEYERGPQAPVPHLAKARVLGRLSVLSGRRLAARRETSEAVDRWLASIRFSQHLAQGGTLISLFSAQSILIPTLHALAGEISRLDPDSRGKVDTAVRMLPETAFDWSSAIRREESVLATGVRMKLVPNVSAQDLTALRTAVRQIADALQLPPDRARAALAGVKLGALPFPSPIKVNEQREVIRLARQRVVDALAR